MQRSPAIKITNCFNGSACLDAVAKHRMIRPIELPLARLTACSIARVISVFFPISDQWNRPRSCAEETRGAGNCAARPRFQVKRG
jgi:hypothetical protein